MARYRTCYGATAVALSAAAGNKWLSWQPVHTVTRGSEAAFLSIRRRLARATVTVTVTDTRHKTGTHGLTNNTVCLALQTETLRLRNDVAQLESYFDGEKDTAAPAGQ